MAYNFGKVLSDLRTEKGITQFELAKTLNVANTTISSWERNNSEPNFEQLRKIAKHFNVSAGFLLELEN